MTRIAPTHIRYIKLGAGGRWEATALDGGRIEWGIASDPHQPALTGDWAAVHRHYLDMNLPTATATGYVNEAKAFYEADDNTLWVTFARGRMWWAYGGPDVHWTGGDEASHATCHREALGGWCDCDVNGTVLALDRLSTRLTKVASYRRTSCRLNEDQRQLCLRYINAEPDEAQAAVAAAKDELRRTLLTLIQRLSWADFEELTDLMLLRGGWSRVSSLGGVQKDTDLIVEQPLTGERMAVQIKSSANQAIIDDYAARLGLRAPGERLMLVCHSPEGTLRSPHAQGDRTLELLVGEAVAERAIRAGLVDWVMQRAQ